MYVNINCNGLNTARLSLSGPTIASAWCEGGEMYFNLKVRGRYKTLKGLMAFELNVQRCPLEGYKTEGHGQVGSNCPYSGVTS
jgi:hypothetical protein